MIYNIEEDILRIKLHHGIELNGFLLINFLIYESLEDILFGRTLLVFKKRLTTIFIYVS